jgi:hypothetical protein
MSDEISKTIRHIKQAFPLPLAPVPAWESYKSVEEFIEKFGHDFFLDFWKAMYDDLSVTLFLLPFTMQYFLTVESDETSFAVDYLVARLDPNQQKETQSEYYVEKIFASLTREQRKAVCEWLDKLEKTYFLMDVEGAREYWCEKLQ